MLSASLLLFIACRPPAPEPEPLRVLVATWTDEPGPLPDGVLFESAWSHAPKGRPALAALLTGLLPEHNGVRDPNLHGLAVPSLAEHLEDAGFDASARFLGPSPLHSEESWGFGEAIDPALLWIHGPAAVVIPAAEDWVVRHPAGHAFLTSDGTTVATDAEPVPLLWIGPLVDGDRRPVLGATPAPVGHTDVAATIAHLFELETELDGVDLRLGGSDLIVQEDARPALADGYSVVRIERTPDSVSRRAGYSQAPVYDLAPPPWQIDGLPSDPHGVPQVGQDSATAEQRLAELQSTKARLRRGQLGQAERQLAVLEQQRESIATDMLQAEILEIGGDPTAAVQQREAIYAEAPSTALALQLGMEWLELRDPERGKLWFDRALASWPDHPSALLGRTRCAHLLADDTEDVFYAKLLVVDPDRAAMFDASVQNERGHPVDAETLALLEASVENPFATGVLAWTIWTTGDTARAVSIGREGLGRDPRNIALRLDLATWNLELGDARRAARLLAPVARRFPDDLRVTTLYQAAKDALAAERSELEALRASWGR